MNNLFRRLPLKAKLMIIALAPFVFLVYMTCELYAQKTRNLRTIENYKVYMRESANINGLIDALQEERKYSFDYAMTKGMRSELLLQRPITDSMLKLLKDSKNPTLRGFNDYTKLHMIADVRDGIDKHSIRPSDVMQFYSGTVFRLNTLNTLPPANTLILQPVYRDLMAQKALTNMITYLGIIRSNIYNIMHTKEFVEGTLIGTYGAYEVYTSYHKELLAKASPEVLSKYKILYEESSLNPTNEYIDALFKRFSLDDSYIAADWWKISDEGNDVLRTLQGQIWDDLNAKVDAMHYEEERSRSNMLIFLILAMLCAIIFVTLIAANISSTLSRLGAAAAKISNGETGEQLAAESNDAVGQLAESITRIDHNNQVLAMAANEIGKGNFNIEVQPRSPDDILGNALVSMKNELRQYSTHMDDLVSSRTEELARSNDDLRQFAHVASHDLKEPLRKIRMFSRILQDEQKESLSEQGKVYLDKISNASERMSDMIEGILAYSTVNAEQTVFEKISLAKIIEGVENDLELAIVQKKAVIKYQALPIVTGLPLLLHQLFYNLVNNALKFSVPECPPEILISAEISAALPDSFHVKSKASSYTIIKIQDNGIGFDTAYAEQIFSVFTRLNSKDRYEGSGIGLALCRKIAQRHGGDIFAQSDQNGAIFYVALPVQ